MIPSVNIAANISIMLLLFPFRAVGIDFGCADVMFVKVTVTRQHGNDFHIRGKHVPGIVGIQFQKIYLFRGKELVGMHHTLLDKHFLYVIGIQAARLFLYESRHRGPLFLKHSRQPDALHHGPAGVGNTERALRLRERLCFRVGLWRIEEAFEQFYCRVDVRDYPGMVINKFLPVDYSWSPL